MRIVRSQRGNTLITVIIAMGLASMVIFTLATVFSDAFKNQRSIAQSVAAEQEASLLLVALSRPETCSQALLKNAAGSLMSSRTPAAVKKGIEYNEIRIPKMGGGTSILTRTYSESDCKKASNAAICNQVVLSSIKLLPKKKSDGTVIEQPTPDFMLGEVALIFRKTGATSGPDFVTRSVPVGLIVNPATGRITDCQSGGGDINITTSPETPKRRCSPAIYSDKPWLKERIYCRNPGGTIAVLYYAGDGLTGTNGEAIYTSPHGQSPLNIWYNSNSGKFIKYDGSAAQDGGTCINENLKDIVKDSYNTCTD